VRGCRKLPLPAEYCGVRTSAPKALSPAAVSVLTTAISSTFRFPDKQGFRGIDLNSQWQHLQCILQYVTHDALAFEELQQHDAWRCLSERPPPLVVYVSFWKRFISVLERHVKDKVLSPPARTALDGVLQQLSTRVSAYSTAGYRTPSAIGEQVQRWLAMFQKPLSAAATSLEDLLEGHVPVVAARRLGVANTVGVKSACRTLCDDVVLEVKAHCHCGN
jgi:hypothetical protein